MPGTGTEEDDDFDFDAELEAALAEPAPAMRGTAPESSPAPSTGRMEQARRLEMEPIQVIGDPEGRRGRSTGGRRGRVVTGPMVDADAPIEDVPVPGRIDLPLERIEARIPEERPRTAQFDREASENSPWWDAFVAASPFVPTNDEERQSQEQARGRTGQRLSRAWDDLVDDPVGTVRAGAAGLAQGLTGGAADTMMAMQLRGDPTLLATPEGQRAMREPERASYESFREAREGSPELYAMGEGAGFVGQVAGGPAMAASRAPGLVGGLARLGAGAATGAGYGAVSGVGAADPETLEEGATAAFDGATSGAAFGGGAAALGQLGRGGMEVARRVGAGRDRALVAATGGASGATPAVRAFEALPGGVERAAEDIRRLGIVPRVGTVPQIEARALAAREGASRGIQDAFDLAGDTRIPTDDFVAQLETASAGFDRPTARGAQSAVQQMIDDARQAYPDGIPFRAAQDMIEDLRDSGAFVGRAGGPIPLGRQAQQRIYGSLRGSMDGWVGRLGGDDAATAYRAARRDYQVADTAFENASNAANRGAANHGVTGLLSMLGGGVGAELAGAGGMTAGVLGMAALRATQGTLRASGAELAHRIAQTAPERLGPAARQILDAAGRGTAALESTVHVLSQRDARFRAAIEEAMNEGEQQ